MAITLSHIGEPLVQAMAKADPDLFCKHCRLTRVQGLESEVETELKLEPWGKRSFDPVSKVDLGIRVGTDKVVPVEIKMGLKGLSARQVNDRLVPWQHSSHRDFRWKGSMMAVLDRRYPAAHEESKEPLRVSFAGQPMELMENWIIIARRRVVEAWGDPGPGFKQKVQRVIFDDWVEELGEKSFNKSVKTLMPVNFYRRWFDAV